jgi:hypothetical protein
MRSIAKSLLMALVGTGIFFSFLMMTVIPIQAALARLGGNISKLSVVINPSIFLRSVGIPIAVAVFCVLFVLAMHKLRHSERQAALR